MNHANCQSTLCGLLRRIIPVLCLFAFSVVACQNPLDKVITAKISEVVDTRLSVISVSLSAGTTFASAALSPAFDPEVTSYTVSGDALVNKAALSASLADSGASLEYQVDSGSWKDLSSGGSTGNLDLPAGTTRLSLRATSENDLRKKIYTIDVVVPAKGEGKPAVLSAVTPSPNAHFGDVVAMSDNGLVLAASNTVGGGVAVYTRATTSSAWTYLRALTVSGASSSFGSALSVSGDGSYLAIGSRDDDAAYVFDVVTGSLLFFKDIGNEIGYYGYCVALSGDGSVLAVGYYRYWGASANEGRVFTYRSLDSWKDTPSEAEIAAPETTYESGFGSSLALSGDGSMLVVGAPQYKATYSNVGVIYAFEYDAGTNAWSSPTPVVGPTEDGSYFGTAVDVSSSGDLILGGAPGPETGEAWLFSWNGSTATQVGAVIKAPTIQNYEHFGKVVALAQDGLHMLIGSPEHDDSVKGLDTGVVYLYTIGSDYWSYVDGLADPWGEDYGGFGGSVCLGSGSSPTVVAGSPGTAVEGHSNAGAVFVF